ncbi:MAG: GGDEF domain-containing protein, partial [Pseudonocardia sp.]|nr:GGDEF domain-containing protein [Pseudonocardia sp.]
ALLAERIRDARARPGACLLYIDLDGFKSVNDRFGHAGGDAVLRQLADRLTELLGPEDTAARLGGDEFAVLSIGGEADRFRAAAARPFVVDGVQVALSAAVGATDVGHRADERDPSDLLGEADQRMYQAKRRDPAAGLLRR